jgi:hypothetical protein
MTLGLMASPASAQTIACNLPTGAGVITPYAGVPPIGGTTGTDTVAVVHAHCLSLDGSAFTATLEGAIFYTADAVVCGSSSASKPSIQGEADPIVTIRCHTDITDVAHFTSAQIGHAIVTAGAATENNLFPVA